MVTVSDIDYSTFRLLQQLLFALFFCDFRTFPLSFADVLQSIHQRRITLPRCVVDAWTRSSVLVAIGTSMDDDSVYSQFQPSPATQREPAQIFHHHPGSSSVTTRCSSHLPRSIAERMDCPPGKFRRSTGARSTKRFIYDTTHGRADSIGSATLRVRGKRSRSVRRQ